MLRGKALMLFLVVALAPAALFSFAAEKPAPMKLKPALLVIDIQNAFLPHMDEQDVKRGMEMINYTIDLFRENGFPVIRVYHTSPGEGPDPGTEAFEFPKTVHIRDDDPKVVKKKGLQTFVLSKAERDRWKAQAMALQEKQIAGLGEFGRKIKEIADEANKKFPYDEKKLK